MRASGLRQRSAKAKARRAETKRKRIEERFGSNSGMDWRDPRAWNQSKKNGEVPQRLLLRPFQRLRFCFGLSCDCPFGRSSGCFFGHSSSAGPETALRPLQRLLLRPLQRARYRSCSSAAPAAASSATPVSPLQKLLFGRSSGCCFSGRDVSSPGGRRDGWDSVFSDFVKTMKNKQKKQKGTKSD